MVYVVGIAAKYRTAADQAAQNGKGHVENRDAESQYRNGDSRTCRCFLTGGHGQRAQQKADEQAAGVSHEDAGWIKVEGEKPEDRAQQDHHEIGDQVIVAQQADHQQGDQRNHGRTGG